MTKSLVRSQFGAHAEKYATSSVHAKGASLARLVELVRPQASWRVLDVATGAGHMALALAPHVAEVVASDITKQMLAQTEKLAAERGLANVRTWLADAERLPFADDSFDLVTCRIAAHHFQEIAMFLVQTRRVLKPGAIFALVDNVSPDALSTPGFSKADLRDAALKFNAFEKLRDPSHQRALTSGEWTELIADCGFELQHAERLAMEMAFMPWAERIGASAETVERLREILICAAPALAAYLRTRQQDGALWFTLDEIIMIARKPVSRRR